jgi:hypothetical protein
MIIKFTANDGVHVLRMPYTHSGEIYTLGIYTLRCRIFIRIPEYIRRRFRMLSRFIVLLTLYTCVMSVGNLHLGQDDTRLTGVHIRTLVSALQVWIVSVLLSIYCLFMFFIHVVKSERTSIERERVPKSKFQLTRFCL